MSDIGILHPGQMGISVAASAKNSGNTVYWAGAGRSAQSRARAEEHGLLDAGTLADLCQQVSVVLSICPPHAAEDVARDVMATGFRGLYVDGNAIAPQRAKAIGALVEGGGATFVDGGIIGGPAWKPGATWLYLAGEEAAAAATCFSAGPLETEILGPEAGQASALKMCFAAYTKGTTALLTAVLGTADSLGVRQALVHQWQRDGSDFAESTERRVRQVTAKAWRFAGEMEEIAATFESAGLPGGFHQAAHDVYTRLADFKDAPETPSLDAVLAALQQTTSQETP